MFSNFDRTQGFKASAILSRTISKKYKSKITALSMTINISRKCSIELLIFLFVTVDAGYRSSKAPIKCGFILTISSSKLNIAITYLDVSLLVISFMLAVSFSASSFKKRRIGSKIRSRIFCMIIFWLASKSSPTKMFSRWKIFNDLRTQKRNFMQSLVSKSCSTATGAILPRLLAVLKLIMSWELFLRRRSPEEFSRFSLKRLYF